MGTPFSTLIRTASHEQHTEAESTTFMSDLLGGSLGVDAYARYTEQLWFVYRALEEAAKGLEGSAVSRPVHPGRAVPGSRHRAGSGPPPRGRVARRRFRTAPATQAYASRVAECAQDWPGGYVAHHYTRYLGDLSGGQIIRDKAEKNWGFARKGDGVRFYVFEGVPNPAAFKRSYRVLLDGVRADELEKLRIVAECKRAFALNTAVFRALGEEFSSAA